MKWTDILKDDWVPKRIGSKDNPLKPKISDRIIAFLKSNPSGVTLPTIIRDGDTGNWSSKRIRNFLQNHPNVSSQKKYLSVSGNTKRLYFWRGE